MESVLYPNPKRFSPVWRRFENIPLTPAGSNLVSLYIGSDKNSATSLNYAFKSGFLTENLLQAQQMFLEVPRENLPNVILLDLPLNKPGLQRFHNFLKEHRLLNRTIVIYNETNLKQKEIQYLKEHELVDDIISMDISGVLLKRLAFLEKVKSSNYHRPRLNSRKVIEAVSKEKRTIFIKRMIDISCSLLMLIFLSPIMILIGLLIKIDSPGPIIYSSLRAGRGFKIFKFYKFRTMVVGADAKIEEFSHLNQYATGSDGQPRFVKISNDPRITKLGRILRNYSLDELPQLINVLKGDMSVVGNRPLPLYEASTLTTNEHVERFMAPAGITGLWQIKKRGQANMSVEERISLDISYARKYNVIFDMWIVANTPGALIQKSDV